MNMLYPVSDITPQVEELKSVKYCKALKVIQKALNDWGYDSTCGDKNDPSFIHFVGGVIEMADDWSSDDNEL